MYYKRKKRKIDILDILLFVGVVSGLIFTFLNFVEMWNWIEETFKLNDDNVVSITNSTNENLSSTFSYDDQEKCVVAIEVATNDDTAIGSGTIINSANVDGLYTYQVITNEHVIADALSIKIVYKDVNNSYQRINASLIKSDDTVDLALLQFTTPVLFSTVTYNDDVLNVSDTVYSIGTDLNLTFYNSLSTGMISGLDRTFTDSQAEFIQHTCNIVPGNSGGPLFDNEGELVGINALRVISGNDTLFFSIDLDTLITFIGS